MSLNLLHGGGRRVSRLVEYSCQTGADALVLGEFKIGQRAEELTASLRAAGYANLHLPMRPPGNSVLLASRGRSRRVRLDPAPIDRHRIVAAKVEGLTLVGVYAQNQIKASLFDYLLSRPAALGGACLVIGDMNTGLHQLDEPGSTFACADRFALLEERGYVDLWRRQHGHGAREMSWVSPRGIGYRIDHAFATEAAAGKLVSCRYDHATRGDISDHSALVVELAE